MARKKLNVISKRGKSSTYDFKDLSDPDIYNRLTKKQQYYIEEYNKMYGADLLAENQEYYDMLTREIQGEIRYRQYQVLTGRSYRHAQKVYFDNYITGLKSRGMFKLADLLKDIIKSKKGQAQRQALIDNLSELDLYYGRNDRANKEINNTMADDAIAQSASAMIEYALENGINVLGNHGQSNFTLDDIEALMHGDYVDTGILGYLRKQEIEKLGSKKKAKANETIRTINRWLGLKESDITIYEDE